MSRHTVFTSESVTRGHPDKLCDTISDAVVARYLRQDPLARVTVESAVSTGIVFVAAKLRTEAVVDVPRVVREVVADVGYDSEEFNPRDCTVMTSLSEVREADRIPRLESEMTDEEVSRIVADTPITVFGYACDHTPALLPLPIELAHRLARRLALVGRTEELWLSPDGTTQVSVEFDGGRPVGIQGVSILARSRSGQTPPVRIQRARIREAVVEPVLRELPDGWGRAGRVDINPAPDPLPGGPARHAGLTGRKTQVDTYGEYSRGSGSALSGKDPCRIDRIGAYAARHAAKCVVSSGLAREAEVVLTYTPGRADPVSLAVHTLGSGLRPDDAITDRVEEVFDFRPGGIVRRFRLRDLALGSDDGFYPRLAAYGQMGRSDVDAPWERTDEAEALRN